MPVETQTVVETPISVRKVGRNASIYLFAQIISWIVTFATLSIIPRSIGKSGSGILAVLSNAFASVSLLTLGIDQYLIKEIGRDRKQTETLMRATYGIRLITLPIVFGLYMTILYFLRLSPALWLIAITMIISALPYLFAEPIRSMLLGWEQPRRVAIIDISQGIANLLAIPFLRFGPIAIVAAGLVINYVMLVVRWNWVRKDVTFWPSFDMKIWWRLVRGGMPFIINIWILQWYGIAGVFFLNHFVNKDAVGIYANAQKLIGTFMFVTAAISNALMPSMARLADQAPEELRKLESRIIGILIIAGVPWTLLLIMLAKPISDLLFGATFFEMPLTLQTYAVALIPIYIVATIYQFTIARGKNGIWTIFLIVTVGVFALACRLLVPFARDHFHNGATGAAAATVIAESLAAVVGILLLRVNLLSLEFLGRLLRCAVATMGMCLVIWLTQRFFIAVPSILGIATFIVIAVKIHVLPEHEQNLIIAAVRRKLRIGTGRGQNPA